MIPASKPRLRLLVHAIRLARCRKAKRAMHCPYARRLTGPPSLLLESNDKPNGQSGLRTTNHRDQLWLRMSRRAGRSVPSWWDAWMILG